MAGVYGIYFIKKEPGNTRKADRGEYHERESRKGLCCCLYKFVKRREFHGGSPYW